MKRTVLLLLLIAGTALAQYPTVERGIMPDKLYQFNGIDTVNVFNGNLILRIPIGQRYPIGPNLDYGLTLTYNSKVWDSEQTPSTGTGTPIFYTTALPNRRSNAGLGWTLSMGRLLNAADPLNDSLAKSTYEDATGADHVFAAHLHDETCGSSCLPSGIKSVGYARDGSYLRQKELTAGGQVIEQSNGEVEQYSTDGRLTGGTDPFSNQYNISYTPSSGPADTWTITDGRGRTHTVTFKLTQIGGAQANYVRVVDSVVLSAFGSSTATATYQFHYDNVSIARGCGNDDPYVGDITVPFLTSITLPDGSSYTFTYSTASNTNCEIGALTSMTLPTLGRIDWTYQSFNAALPGCDPYFYVSSPAVATKKEVGPNVDPSTVDPWSYQFDLVNYGEYPKCHPDDPITNPNAFAPEEMQVTVTSPLHHKTVHHFSIWAPWPTPNSNPYGFRYEDFGLPFTRIYTSGSDFLSVDEYDCPTADTCTKKRSSYVRYDDSSILTDSPARVVGTRTVFHDDSDNYVQSELSDFDGYGHYRSSVTSSSFSSGELSRTATTRFNPGTDAKGRINSTSSLYLNPYSWWLLDTYDRQWVAENGTAAVTDACFDTTTSGSAILRTGFLKGRRTYKTEATVQSDGSLIIGSSPNDIVASFTSTSDGFVGTEEWFGGDIHPLPSGYSDLCTAPSSASDVQITHGYSNGMLATTQYRNMTWKSLDRDIDARTGLVSAMRDPTGLLTALSYDTSSRLTSVATSGLASISYAYANASPRTASSGGGPDSPLTPASVTTTQSDVQSVLQYDWLGRPWREKKLMPDATWSLRETLYDGLSRRLSVSELEKLVIPSRPANAPPNQPDPTDIDFVPVNKTGFAYDAFGLPKVITAPDGNTTRFAYFGARETRRTSAIAAAGPVPAERDITTQEIYDGHGRLASVTEAWTPSTSATLPEETTASYAYDVANRLQSVSMPGGTGPQQTRYFNYDQRGFLQNEQHPEIGSSGNGITYYSKYDARGHAGRRLTGAQYGTYDLAFTFDDAERVTNVDQNTGAGTTRPLKEFAYDAYSQVCTGTECRGKLAASARWNYFDDLGTIATTEAIEYHGLANLPSRRDTAIGTTSSFTGTAFFFGQSYNTLGQPASINYPCHNDGSGQCADTVKTVPFTYTKGLLTSMDSWASITYQPGGMISTVTHGSNGMREHWMADPHGMSRPCAILGYASGTTLSPDPNAPCGESTSGSTPLWSSGTYLYDASGNVKQIGQTSYGYDGVSRLSAYTQTTVSSGLTNSFFYDSFGNSLYTTTQGCVTDAGTQHCFTTGVIRKQITGTTNHYASMSYDDVGNVTADGYRALSYDSLGMTRTAAVGGRDFRYLYTADDERIALIERLGSQNKTTWTLRGFGNQLLRSYVDDGTTFTWKEDELWRGAALLAIDTPSGAHHNTLDHLGSPRLLTDNSGTLIGTQDFAPFGGGGTSNGGSLQFTAHERDASVTGADLPDSMHARMYDPGLGRFLSVDSSYDEDTLHLPQKWNRYSYVTNNPLRYTDPNGRDRWDVANGYFNSLLSDFGLTVRIEQGNTDYQRGQRGGDQAGATAGFIISTASATGGVVTSPTGVGAIAGVAGAVYGAAVMTNAANHLSQDSNPRSGGTSDRVKTIVEESAAAKKADSFTGKMKQGYEQIKDLLASGQPGKNQHALTGDLKGWYAADLPGSGRGRGAARVIYKVEDNQVVIKDIVDYH